MRPTRLHIVNHTHWDREWYFPFQAFRVRLVHVIETALDLLDRGAIRYFMLDGQAVVLEDLAEVASPALLDRLRRRLTDGSVSAGPWYILPDEFLVSGESLVRNLQEGRRIASAWGPVAAVGYAPDTFGHVSQLPQILSRAGIDNAVASRGINAEPTELWWEAPDGTRVLLLFLPQTYYQQPVLDQAEYDAAVVRHLEEMGPRSTNGEVLLMNGGDHLAPIADFAGRLVRLRQALPGVEVAESTLVGHLERVARRPDLAVTTGEQRHQDLPWLFLLPGVLSTRTYLKQWNDRLEDRLTGLLEPLALMAGADRQAHLEYLWRMLLRNQPHDSICGCSVDEVHQEMMARYEALDRETSALQADLVSRIWPLAPGQARDYTWAAAHENPEHAPGTCLQVYNPLPVRRSFVAELTVAAPQGMAPVLPMPFDLLERRDEWAFYSPLRGVPGRPELTQWQVRVQVEQVPGMGFATLPVTFADAGVPLAFAAGRAIRTDRYDVQLEAEGTLTVTERWSGKVHRGLAALGATLDAGDTYNYSPPATDLLSSAVLRPGSARVRQGKLGAELRYTLELPQPAGVRGDRTGPAAEQVTSVWDLHVALYEHDPVIHLEIAGTNQACDQRLRLRMPLGGHATEAWSDSSFDVVRRKVTLGGEYQQPEKGYEYPCTTFPASSFSWAGGVAILHEGLHEHEVEGGETLAVTLLRSVGWLGRQDLRYRSGGAGPEFATPGAQCLGPQRFRLGMVLGEPVEALPALARGFRVQPAAFQVHSAVAPAPLLEVEGAVQVTAVKPAAGEPGAIAVRAYNPSDTAVEAVYRFGRPIRRPRQADLLERRLEGPETPGQAVHLAFGPKEIKTILVYPDEPLAGGRGLAARPVDAVNPTGGAYAGGRGPDQLVCYTSEAGRPTTGTNSYGMEAVVAGGSVVALGGNNSPIPVDGFVLSAHGVAKTWMQESVRLGSRVRVEGGRALVETGVEAALAVARQAVAKGEAGGQLLAEAEGALQAGDPVRAATLAEQAAEAGRTGYYRAQPSPTTELRGVWHRPVEQNAAEVEQFARCLSAAGMNALFLESIWGGRSIYPGGPLEQRPEFAGWDPLAAYVEACQAHGIELHAWVHVFFVGHVMEGSAGPVLGRHPEWATLTRADALAGRTGPHGARWEEGYLFANPAMDEVQDFLAAAFCDLTARYLVRGLHLDYIRYSVSPLDDERLNDGFSYDPYSRERFQAEHGADPLSIRPQDHLWQAWAEWRRGHVTRFVRRIRRENPGVALSVAVFPDPHEALETKYQDWISWARQGLLDFLCPMVYTLDHTYVQKATAFMREIVPPETGLYTGLAPYLKLAPEALIDQVKAARDGGAEGVVFFESRALLRPEHTAALLTGPFRNPARR